MNDFQTINYSAALAVLGIIWMFFGFGDDDDEGGGMMIPLRQDAS